MILAILVVLLVLALFGGGYGFRSGNRYAIGGGGLFGLVILILLVLLLTGRI